MNKKTRIIIFLACFLLFILIAPMMIFYAQGYRIDLDPPSGRIKITQAGGLFLKVTPRQANIYINEKLAKRTDFFFGSVLIENLLPKKHKIEIKKDGYHSWQKTLEIKEKEVIEAKNIILFPEEIKFNALSGKTKEFWLSPDKKKIVSFEEEKDSSSLKLYDLDKNIKSHLVEISDISTLAFSDDSKKVYMEIHPQEEEKQYFSLEIEKEKPVLIKEELIEPNKEVYYFDELGHLSANKERVSQEPFLIKEDAEYNLKIFDNFVFLREDNGLYKFNFDSGIFESFFENARPLKISPDNKKLIFWSNNEIWIFFLKHKNDPPEKKAGEKLFLFRLSEKIADVSWINDNYFIVAADGTIKISEIDDRNRINIIDAFETKKLPQNGNIINISFSQFDKKIYLLTEQGFLYSSSQILP